MTNIIEVEPEATEALEHQGRKVGLVPYASTVCPVCCAPRSDSLPTCEHDPGTKIGKCAS